MRLALVLLLAGCATTTLPAPSGSLPAAGLQRFYKVEGNFYRSWQPTEEQFKVLASQYGIKTVIKLNYPIEGRDHLPDGVEEYHHPINVLADVLPSYIDQILNDIDEALTRGPVLVHCSHGEDRTGLIVALWKLRHHPMMSKLSLWNEMISYGFHDGKFNKPGLPELVETFVHITGFDPNK